MHRLLPDHADEVDVLAAYAVPEGIPHLRVNFVQSADGSVAIEGVSGPLSNPADKDIFFALRGLSDVVLVGAGTVQQEDYGPVRRTGTDHRPPIAVVTNRLTLDPGAKLFADVPPEQRPIILTTDEADASAFADIADIVRCGPVTVNITRAVAALRARGHARILCEGGPTLFGTLLAAGLVDELDLSLAPLLAVSRGPSILHNPDGGPPVGLELAQLLADGDWLFARYTVRSP